MKTEVLQTLLTAKVLFGRAQDLCFVEDRYTASAGLIVLQDALELVFLSSLIEKSVDEIKSLERFSFDQLIGELKVAGVTVSKSGTLKALNKQRVIVKHYGQVSEPHTVATYYSVGREAADNVLRQVIGKSLQELVLHEQIKNAETREYLTEACEALENDKFFKCLVNVRKAIFVEIESEYCIYEWREHEPGQELGLMGLLRGGLKAPYYTRNRIWIAENVKDPFDFIQRDHDSIRQDLLEWGASTQDFWNVRRLTPEVVRLGKDGNWLLKGELKHLYQGATRENAIFCLDRAITLLGKKQSHSDMARSLDFSASDQLRVRLTMTAPLHKKADPSSDVLVQLEENVVYDAQAIVPGLSGEGRYAHVVHGQKEEPRFLVGYVDLETCEILEPATDA